MIPATCISERRESKIKGEKMKTATFTKHVPTKGRPTQKWVLTDNETGEILAYSHKQKSAIEYAEGLGYVITNSLRHNPKEDQKRT